ncbi:MAG: polyprenyl synthetase family protein [Candidatus Kapabacteria bacterium]|jgi:geranylgeranyl diphosphate synthase type II|nr:polyprenyl synthetase family protein [Candidatus Kapabacteria bacterium]
MTESIDYEKQYIELLGKAEKYIFDFIPVSEPKEIYEPFKYIVSGGGKRIRPVLAMISAGAVGGQPEDALKSAASIEILHNFTLVHDDIMDESPVRRSRDTVHIKWDEPTAILSGDLMVGYAYKVLPSTQEHERSAYILNALTNALIEVCEGQAYDMKFNERGDVSYDEYLLMIEKKTSRLLETAAVMGGHSGLGTDEQIKALEKYAYNVGIAFQIQDDLLDITADQDILGKTIGLDIVEGKKTYLIIKCIEKATSPEHKELLKRFTENCGLSLEDVPVMKSMMENLGVLNDAGKTSEKYFNQALESLNGMPDNEYTEMLKWLVHKLNKRNY